MEATTWTWNQWYKYTWKTFDNLHFCLPVCLFYVFHVAERSLNIFFNRFRLWFPIFFIHIRFTIMLNACKTRLFCLHMQLLVWIVRSQFLVQCQEKEVNKEGQCLVLVYDIVCTVMVSSFWIPHLWILIFEVK